MAHELGLYVSGTTCKYIKLCYFGPLGFPSICISYMCEQCVYTYIYIRILGVLYVNSCMHLIMFM